VGVCDIDKSRAKRVAKRFGTSAFTDYRDLLSQVGAISVVVPTEGHYKVAKDFLLHGVHTLIEKPITALVNQADDLIKIATKNKLVLQVGHVERFNSAIKALKLLKRRPKFIEAHRLGPFDPRTANIGVALDLMIHDIDIILDMADSKIKGIEAIGANILSKHEDIANARIRFKDGCVANLTASRLTKERMRKIRIFQEDAYISIDYLRQSARIHKKVGDQIQTSHVNIKKEEPLKLELEEFINCVLNPTEPPPVDRGAREALVIALQIKEEITRSQRCQQKRSY